MKEEGLVTWNYDTAEDRIKELRGGLQSKLSQIADLIYRIVVFSQRTQFFNSRSSLLIKKLYLQIFRIQFILYKPPQICS